MHTEIRSLKLRGRRALLATACLLSPLAAVPATHAQDLNQREETRRLQLVTEARELMAIGDEAYAAGRHEAAVEAFSGAFSQIPDAPATAELRQAAGERYATAAVERARELLRGGDLAAARGLLDAVLAPTAVPGHPGALAFRDQLDDPLRTNPALNADHGRNVDEVRRLLYTADGAFQLGKFDEAITHYQDALRVDPYNRAARRGMERAQAARSLYFDSARDEARAGMLRMVESAWELQIQAPELEASVFGIETGRQDLGRVSPAAKLERIIIPNVNLEGVTLEDSLDFLRARTRELDTTESDPARQGVNFRVDAGPAGSAEAERLRTFRFDLRLGSMPASQVLRFITEQTRTRFSSDDFAVVIRPTSALGEDMVSRSFRVPPDFMGNLSAATQGGGEAAPVDPFAAPATGGGLLAERRGARELFADMGVSFPEGASISFVPGNNVIRATNTLANMDLIEQIVDSIANLEPVIVTLQVTILSVEETRLKELGFDWLLAPVNVGGDLAIGGGTPGNGSPLMDFPLPSGGGLPGSPITSGNRSGSTALPSGTIDDLIAANTSGFQQSGLRAPGAFVFDGTLNDSSVQTIIRALDQQKGVDRMASPSVSTRPGQESSIRMVQELIYPTEYEPPELPNDVFGDSVSPVTPATPTAFTMREVGVSLNMVPNVGADRRMVEVTLNPEIVQFDGFVNYGSPITSPIPANLGTGTVEVTPNAILMPVFSVSRTNTSLMVADGANFVFSGLMSQSVRIVDDKVPLLGDLPLVGRFFQSRVSQPTSTAVIFMVKVRLTDPTGRPINDF